MQVTTEQIKNLREKTGAGMMDCKKALIENNGDFEAAVDWLRKKGHAASAKRSMRSASEGLIGIKISGHKAALIELNSETDFVARNEKFQGIARDILNVAIDCSSLDALQEAHLGESNVKEELIKLSSVIGENLVLRRLESLSTCSVLGSYVHNAFAPNLGKIGVVVALDVKSHDERAQDCAKKIAMHIAATAPLALRAEDIDPSVIQRERQILSEKFATSGKPAEIVQRMVDSAVQKFVQESALLEQVFVMDSKTTIKGLLASLSKELGNPVSITGYLRLAVGQKPE